MTQMPTGAIPRWAFIILIWIKNCCGLTKAKPRKGEGPDGTYAAELTPEKKSAIRAAFIRFRLIELDKK